MLASRSSSLFRVAAQSAKRPLANPATLLRARPFSSDDVKVPVAEALATTTKALEMIGWDNYDAKLQATIMVSAQSCGNNQGLVKMYQPALMAPSPGAQKPVIERDTPSSAIVNANQSPGMVAAGMAAEIVTNKLKNDGVSIAVVGSHNTCTSSGQMAYYAGKIAQTGAIGIACGNSPEFVAVTEGAKAVFGTNPIAFGIPVAGQNPLLFDMATSATTLFGVLTAKAAGQQLPEKVAYGKDGKYTRDPSQALPMDGGAIATFGAHKGAGLALMIELLGGVLANGAVLGQCESKMTAKSWGHLMIAINPDKLVDDFAGKSKSVIEAVKASKGAGFPDIILPGSIEDRIRTETEATGVLDVGKAVWDVIQETAKNGLPK
jgi:LDH2 family malate/lactate/ureidoglycolate dehydrogenase